MNFCQRQHEEYVSSRAVTRESRWLAENRTDDQAAASKGNQPPTNKNKRKKKKGKAYLILTVQ